jgi:secreted trypsin-like serine protease
VFRTLPATVVIPLALALAACTHGAPAPTTSEALPATKPYPAEAALTLDSLDGRGPQPWCGATLIARAAGLSWFLTAAHCMTDDGHTTVVHGNFSLGLGDNDRRRQTTYAVTRIVVHPGWQPATGTADIALLAVDATVPETPAVISPAHPGEGLTLLGWGRTTLDSTAPHPTNLHYIHATVVDASKCRSAGGFPPGIATGDLCAEPAPGTAIFPGDSGSGARDADDHLVGSMSRNPTVGASVYTAVANYLPWITQVILNIQPPRGLSPQQQLDVAMRELTAAQ